MVLIHPGRLTAGNRRIYPWKRKSIFQSMSFRFYVNLPECKCTVDFLYIINQHYFDQITMKITLTMKKAGKQLKCRFISGHFFRGKKSYQKATNSMIFSKIVVGDRGSRYSDFTGFLSSVSMHLNSHITCK